MRIGIERLVQVDKLDARPACHLVDGVLDLGLPVPRARLEAWVLRPYRCSAGDEDAHLGIDRAQGVDEVAVVGDELVTVVGPVAWVGIVDPEVDDGDVGLIGQRLPILLLLDVGTVAALQQGRPRLTEVAHLVALSQHALQECGVGLLLSIR